MQQELAETERLKDDISEQTIAVVGSGPVGVHFVNELMALNSSVRIHLFGEEETRPYNRVALSQLLSGEYKVDEIALQLKKGSQLETHFGTRVMDIDQGNLVTVQGEMFSYDKLVLATGSRAHIPNIPNIHISGTYVLRTLKDAEALMSRQAGSRRTIVLGGGLLGIEAARAMSRLSTEVVLIHHSPWLMNHQLDEQGATILKDALKDQGISVRLNESISKVEGERQMSGVELRSGEKLSGDTLIIATGISPNIQLAKDLGISVGRGIKVNEALATGRDNIFAIGECAEFQGEVVGLVAPGLEQASVLAHRLAGNANRVYEKKIASFQLKVLDKAVASAGTMGSLYQDVNSKILSFRKGDDYRALRVEKGRVKGMGSIGLWEQGLTVKSHIERDRRLFFWQKQRFLRTGNPFRGNPEPPDTQVICNCKQVTRGEIKACLAQGETVASTGAGSVCGSCEPLLATFDATLPVKKQKPETPLLLMAGVGLLLLAGFWQLAPFALPTSYQPDHISKLWQDSFYRQITGFTVLGLTLLSFLFSLRKRFSFFEFWSFGKLRFFHAGLTVASLALLFLHTGLSDFQGINQWLIYTFFLAVVGGALTGFFADLEKRFASLSIKRMKAWSVFVHIVSFWPLPVLLAFHILSVYWF